MSKLKGKLQLSIFELNKLAIATATVRTTLNTKQLCYLTQRSETLRRTRFYCLLQQIVICIIFLVEFLRAYRLSNHRIL